MWKLVLLLLGIVAMVGVACGDGGDETVPPDTADPVPFPTEAPAPETVVDVTPPASAGETVVVESAPADSPTAAPEAMDITTPVEAAVVADDGIPRGGVFRRNWSDPPTLDPHMTTDTTAAGIVVEVFGGLVTINTDLQLELDLAESMEVSDDGLTYTFTLRSNARFHDGKPVTAHDFKWSIERAASPTTGSPVADTYLNDIIGVEDVLDSGSSLVAVTCSAGQN